MTQDLQKEVERLERCYLIMWNALFALMEDGHADCELCQAKDRIAMKAHDEVRRLETPPTTSDHYPSLPTPAKESLIDAHDAIWPGTKHISPEDAKFLRSVQANPPEDGL